MESEDSMAFLWCYVLRLKIIRLLIFAVKILLEKIRKNIKDSLIMFDFS